ncbi:MAG: hypothetical protein Q4A79_02360 [Candidatus Saccharibacteria bacterium]|nr:hypothetical protein [Candidatus Saccharibacteria bacterium]
MAKEIAIGKRATISKAQQYMLLSIAGTAIMLGAAVCLVSYFIKKIAFNVNVIAEEEKSVVAYSDAIKNIGICTAPKGRIYSDSELEKCSPNDIDIYSISGTLRANILEGMASNAALNSVPKESTSNCINPSTGKNYTYKEMNAFYNAAETGDELVAASKLIQKCSALRVIPEALPAFKNEEALLSSLNKIFILSNWEPDSLVPSGEADASLLSDNLNAFSVRFSVEANSATVMNVLNNIERSIREFNFERASLEWSSEGSLTLEAQATAFYMNPSILSESDKIMTPGTASSATDDEIMEDE